MGSKVTSTVQGLDELKRKIGLLKSNMDGPPLTKVLREAAKPIQQQARRNARKGPTGLVQKGVSLFAGKKASKFGATVVVKAKWKGTGAVFEEWGTKERVFNVMKVPFSKLGALAKVGNFGSRKSATVWTASRIGGFAFFRKAAPMTGTRFFENAVEQKTPEAQKAVENGLRSLINEAVK
jgi:HK97 gp10 family phage protein